MGNKGRATKEQIQEAAKYMNARAAAMKKELNDLHTKAQIASSTIINRQVITNDYILSQIAGMHVFAETILREVQALTTEINKLKGGNGES